MNDVMGVYVLLIARKDMRPIGQSAPAMNSYFIMPH